MGDFVNLFLCFSIFMFSIHCLESFKTQDVYLPPGSPQYMDKASENPELLELLRQKKYDQLIKQYEEQPKIFDLPSEYTAAAIAYFTKGDYYKTVHICVKSMKFRDFRAKNKCGRLAARIKKQNPGKYRLALADFYLKDKDYSAALIKYYRLIEDNLELEKTRMGLIKLFKKNNHPEYVLDQYQYLENHSNKKSIQDYLKNQKQQYTKSYSRLKIKDLERNHKSVYRMMILNGKANKKFYTELVGMYEDDLLNSYSAETALRIANLYMLQKQYSRVLDVLGQLDYRVPELAQNFTLKDKLAYSAIINRLPKKEQKMLSQSIQVDSSSISKDDKAFDESQLPFAKPIIDRNKYKHFAPFDFTEVTMASNENLEAFDNLASEFNNRFSSTDDPYKQRWLYERINDKVNEMYTHRMQRHNMNPESLPIGKWFLTDGKQFKEQLSGLKGKYMADDLIGSKQYRGNLQRLKKELNEDKGLDHKRKVLKRFYLWWDSLMFRERDPFVRGAFRAYMRSPEGVVLLKTARKHTTRINEAKFHNR